MSRKAFASSLLSLCSLLLAESDHRANSKEALELLVKALHQRQAMGEGMKKSQRISEGLQQDKELYADLACKYDLRLAWFLMHNVCMDLYTAG